MRFVICFGVATIAFVVVAISLVVGLAVVLELSHVGQPSWSTLALAAIIAAAACAALAAFFFFERKTRGPSVDG